MSPELSSHPRGIVADLPAQKKKGAKKADPIREEGNALFRAGDFAGAARKYSEALAANPADAAALANRAECFLRARQFQDALEDAVASHAADPTHHKSLYKRAMALNGLGRYPDALATIEQLLEIAPDDPAAKHALLECQLLRDQAFAGKYDPDALLFRRQATSFRRCADYVGPVTVAPVPGGRGRGVVAARAVKRGELLCVSSPLAVAPIAPGAEMALVQGLVAAASRNPADARLVAETLPAAKHFAAKTSEKKDAEDANAPLACPSMALFRRHLGRGDPDVLPVADVASEAFARRAADVVKTCAIRSERSVGVYPLPSFFNHGCAPNACKVLVGHTMFVRAARDLAKDEEVCVKYFDVLAPAPERQAQAKKWGFECACLRCASEAPGADATARAAEKALAAAKNARERAVADPANKRPGGDKDGERAFGAAYAAEMEAALLLGDEDKDASVNNSLSLAAVIATTRAKAKALHGAVADALKEWKRTRGASPPPDANVLAELIAWFEARLDALGLDATRREWAKASVVQLYANANHCLVANGALEARHATLEATARALEAADPASFEHCKHVAALGMNARRVGKKAWVERAEAAQAEVFAARYLGPEGADDEERTRLVRELVERAEQSLDESSGEFCEA